jgi:hypothetical protein
MHHRCCAANGDDENVTSRRSHFCADRIGIPRQKFRDRNENKVWLSQNLDATRACHANHGKCRITLTSGCTANTILVAKPLIRIFGSRFFS